MSEAESCRRELKIAIDFDCETLGVPEHTYVVMYQNKVLAHGRRQSDLEALDSALTEARCMFVSLFREVP